MADELCSRLTGRSVVDGIDVEVGLVITDAALFGGTSDAVDLTGDGPIPAEVARKLLRPQGGPADETDPAGRDEFADEDAVAACPAGVRCTDFACTKLHGAPPPDRRPTPAAPAASTALSAESASTEEASSEVGPPTTATVAAATVWIRRLFTDPATGRLMARDGRKRLCDRCNLSRGRPRQLHPPPESYRPPPPLLPVFLRAG